MARFVVDFSSVTDGTAGGGTGDNVLIAGGLTFTINAPGNWSANFLNGRLNFQEDPAVGGELFSINIASETGEQLRFDDYQVSVTSNPLWHGGWSGYLRVTNGNSGTSWVPDDATGRGPQYYSEAFPGGPNPSGFLPAVQLYDLNTPGMTTSTTISFWLDNIIVVTIVPPTIDENGPASGTLNTTTFLEDGGAVRITSSDSVLTDDGNLTRITFQLAAAPNGADEAISYDPTLNGGATLASLNLTGSYSSSTRTFTVTGEASSDIYQSVMRAVVYNNSNGAPNVADRTVSIRATDVDGVTGTGTAVIKVSAVNDAPQVSAPSTIAVTEDVASALTGISFSDVDAGSSPVTVELAAASGSLAATAGSGVFVSGSGSSLLSLLGTIAEINAFIAANNVAFTTALNATADVQLMVTVNDEGNSGTGSPLSSSATTTIDVTAVNDAPVNTVPAPQTTGAIEPLVFSSGNGNPISVLDVDSGAGELNVTLTATNGLITLGGTTGLTFLSGNGTANGSMTFSGTITDINAGLNGLSFVPIPGFEGAAGIQIVTNDQGNAGSGGAQSDTDFIPITVDASAPVLTSAAVDGSSLVLIFSEALDATRLPSTAAFAVTVAGSAVAVTGLAVNAGAGTVRLTLESPVGHGENVTVAYSDPSSADDLDAIQDLAGNDADTLPATPVTNNTAAPTPGPNPQPEPPEQPGTPGGDLLQGTPSDDVLDGGGGVDVFRIQANREEVVITRNADGTITVSHPDFGTDTLSNVELLRFDDQVEIINIPTGHISQPGSASFTEASYLAQNPDVAAAVANGLFSSGFEHYQLIGAAEGRSLPKLAIDERFYLSQNDDVAAAVERGEFSSVQEHYLLYGINEGRSPNVLFDEVWYLSQNPDVAGAIAGGAVNSAYEHFQMYGWKEGRDPSAWMDLSNYLADNEDVAAAGLNPLDHFLNHGIHEGRTIQADDSGLWLM